MEDTQELRNERHAKRHKSVLMLKEIYLERGDEFNRPAFQEKCDALVKKADEDQDYEIVAFITTLMAVCKLEAKEIEEAIDYALRAVAASVRLGSYGGFTKSLDVLAAIGKANQSAGVLKKPRFTCPPMDEQEEQGHPGVDVKLVPISIGDLLNALGAGALPGSKPPDVPPEGVN